MENEPLKENDILLTTPGIVVTPHAGGGTADIGDEILPMLAKEIERVINGQMPEHAVNLEYLKKLKRPVRLKAVALEKTVELFIIWC